MGSSRSVVGLPTQAQEEAGPRPCRVGGPVGPQHCEGGQRAPLQIHAGSHGHQQAAQGTEGSPSRALGHQDNVLLTQHAEEATPSRPST